MLTDKQIKALISKDSAYYESDDSNRRGYGRLAIKITPNGTKTFYLMYRFDKKRKFLPLGEYPSLPLKTARKLANDYGQMVFDGKDPRDVLETQHKEAKQAKDEQRRKKLEGNVNQLFSLFITKTKHEKSDQYYKAVKRTLEGEMLMSLGGNTKANTVQSLDISNALSPITKRGSLVMANRARSYLHSAFAYGLQFDLSPERQEDDPLFAINFNPVTAVPKALKSEAVSDRALDETELFLFWKLIEDSKITTERKILLNLLIVFGGRRVNEVIQAPWSEFDLKQGLWNRPGSRDKKGRFTLMPIGRMANELLVELQQITGNNDFLFGEKPPTDYAINQTVRRLITNKMNHFTPKSLRATAKTLMGKIGISKEFRDRYHGHALTDISSKHYDKYDYLDQKKEVVRQWESFLTEILAGKDYQPGLRAVK